MVERLKIFAGEFLPEQLKTKVFKEGKCYFIAFLWPDFHVWHPIECQAMEYGALVAFSLQLIFFSFFHKVLAQKFLEKNTFSNNFLTFLKFTACNVSESDAYHLNCKTDQAMCLVMGFDACFDSERYFSKDLLPKIVKKK